MNKVLKKVSLGVMSLPLMGLFGVVMLWMPYDFAMASWQMWRTDSQTQAEVLGVRTETGRIGLAATHVQYKYRVNGKDYYNDRLGPGIDIRATQTGGSNLTQKYENLKHVTVYYDSSEPEFSILEKGWPRWSIGFSLLVWGILLMNLYSSRLKLTLWRMFWRSLTRAIPWCGVVVIFMFPQYVLPDHLIWMAAVYGAVALCHFISVLWKVETRKRRTW